MSDLISRQDALDAVNDCGICIQRILDIPSAEPEPEEFEWCHDCKEYDQEKHCCHRWTKVIRQTVEDMKNRWQWTPVTEALPENRNVVLVTVYWHETYQVMEASYFGSDWWCVPFNNCGKHMQKLNPIAWMPLPESWRGDR